MLQTTKQATGAKNYLQGMLIKVEKLERLKILEWKDRLYKEK